MGKLSLRARTFSQVAKLGRLNTLTEEKLENKLKKLRTKQPSEYKIPKWCRFKSKCTESTVNGYKVIHMSKNNNPKKMILFIHGGGFLYEISPFHLKMVDNLVQGTDAEAIIPIYPLLPYATYKETYSLIETIYCEYREKYPENEIILAGDSGGGGISMGILEYFAESGIRQPEKTIAISPFINANMDNPRVTEYIDKDVLVSTGFRVCGKWWAGDLDPKDPKISPLFGDISGLDNILFFLGTDEILYPDVEEMYNKLKKAGKKCKLIIGNGLTHVYPIFPTPEGKKAVQQCIEFINGDITISR